MQTRYEPLTARQKRELQGYVVWWIRAVRVLLYFAAIVFVGACLRSIHSTFGKSHSLFANDAWWIIPSIAFAIWLARVSRKWTGGQKGVEEIKSDLANGMIAVHRIITMDAIEIEEQEDEGPSFFVLTTDNEVLFFHGQEFDSYKRRGFPWREFDILETPQSKMLFRLKKRGEAFRPSFVRKPLSYDEMKMLSSNFKRNFRVVPVDFESLKTNIVN
jgi:hypothetical protein